MRPLVSVLWLIVGIGIALGALIAGFVIVIVAMVPFRTAFGVPLPGIDFQILLALMFGGSPTALLAMWLLVRYRFPCFPDHSQ